MSAAEPILVTDIQNQLNKFGIISFFPDRESWEAQILKYEGTVFGKPKYVALSATPAKTTVQVTVNIE